MSSPALRVLFNLAYLMTLSVWVGAGAYHTFVVAPALARISAAPEMLRAGRVLRRQLYAWGSTCFAVALPASLGVPLSYPEYRSPWVALQAGVIVTCIFALIAAGQAGIAAEKAADPGRVGRDRRLIGATMLAALGLILGNAVRPEPRSRGIVEPTPQERARRDAGRWRPIPAITPHDPR